MGGLTQIDNMVAHARNHFDGTTWQYVELLNLAAPEWFVE
jgi:hypothetical protein